MNSDPQKIVTFTQLHVWQKGHEFVLLVYRLSSEFPKSEVFALTSQMRRATVSVTSNLAEGFSRRSLKEKIQFYSMSLGSLTELQNQLLIAKDLGYVEDALYQKSLSLSIEIHKMLNGLIKSLQEKP